jgi:flagellar hook-associated protein 3 FlgL
MRVTANTYTNSLMDQLNRLGLRQTRLQQQATTGQLVQGAADDPTAARRVMDWQAESASVAQFQKNIVSGQNQATAVFAAVRSLKTVSDRAGEIVTRADSLKSQVELTAFADEVTQLIKQAVEAANRKENGSFLFGGTRNDQPPFVMTTDANGRVTGVTYQGGQDLAETEIAPGTSIATSVVGANSTASGPRGLITDGATNADFFNHLISLQNHLLAGDTGAIASTDATQLRADETNLLNHISGNGVLQSRLETTAAIMKDRASALDSNVSQAADADFAQTLVQFNATQNAYQAALQSGAKIMNLSLMDYLR